MTHPDPNLIALSVRQPWAELILRGIKTIEVRTVNTQVRGPIYLYAARKLSEHPAARVVVDQHAIALEGLATGQIVGTVEIESTGIIGPDDAVDCCLAASDLHSGRWIGWRLRNPQPFSPPLAVRFLPYGIWFYPFRRRSSVPRRRRKPD